MGGEAFKRKLLYSAALIIIVLKKFIANVLKCATRLKTKFNFVCVTKCSLVMILFSRDYIKTEID